MSKFPIIKHLIIMIILSVFLVLGTMWFLNMYTKHGSKTLVPELRGKTIQEMAQILSRQNLKYDIVDSIYTNKIAPGRVYEVSPHSGNNVKPGRTLYITINAFSPLKKPVPEVKDLSMRQALALLEASKFNNVTIKDVPGQFDDLCIGLADEEGNSITPNTLIAVNQPLVLLVSKQQNEIDSTMIETDSINDDNEWLGDN